MDSDAVWRIIDEQRVDLADLLDTLSPEQWATRSLCAGWTVRDTAAHLTQSQAGPLRLLLAAARSGFRFDAMIDRMAREDSASPAEITARLRSMVGSRRRPPMTADVDPLTDVLVHGQDICVPLRIDRPMPRMAAVASAERLWSMRFPMNPQRRLPGIRFVAEDAGFDVGSGREVRAPIRDIVMTLAGRPAAISELAAPASDSA